MFHDETQLESHLERSRPLALPGASQSPEGQRKRMLVALGILLMALAAVVLKDWDFWFPPSADVQEGSHPGNSVRNKSNSTSLGTTSSSMPPSPTREHRAAKSAATIAPEVPFSATTERAALPPLQVEVVAGNRRTSVPAKSNAIHLDVDSGATSSVASASASSASGPAPNAMGSSSTVNVGDKVRLSPQTSQSVSVSVPPDYPLLARQMKMQGAVSLRALISRDGTIQELQVLSGPAILANAAREAVRQWHFKPYLQNGQAVETQARITVNFTISTN